MDSQLPSDDEIRDRRRAKDERERLRQEAVANEKVARLAHEADNARRNKSLAEEFLDKARSHDLQQTHGEAGKGYWFSTANFSVCLCPARRSRPAHWRWQHFTGFTGGWHSRHRFETREAPLDGLRHVDPEALKSEMSRALLQSY